MHNVVETPDVDRGALAFHAPRRTDPITNPHLQQRPRRGRLQEERLRAPLRLVMNCRSLIFLQQLGRPGLTRRLVLDSVQYERHGHACTWQPDKSESVELSLYSARSSRMCPVHLTTTTTWPYSGPANFGAVGEWQWEWAANAG